MAFSFVCPLPAALTAIPNQDCPVVLNQIVKMGIRRITARNSSAVTNLGTVEDLLNKTKWTAAIAATDNTKIVITPLVSNFIIPESNIQTVGGNDNTTVDGVALPVGYESQSPTFNLDFLSSNVARALKALLPFSLNGGLEVFLFDGAGNIVYDASNIDDQGDGKPQGFQIYNFAVGPVSSAGRNAITINKGQFSFAEGWDDHFAIAATALEGTPTVWKARDLIAA